MIEAVAQPELGREIPMSARCESRKRSRSTKPVDRSTLEIGSGAPPQIGIVYMTRFLPDRMTLLTSGGGSITP
jgi:hypothetical protein